MLNWLSRYAFVKAKLGFDAGRAKLTESVLDVGCGPHGLDCAMPGASFVGIDVSFPGSVAPGMTALRNSPGPLPFEDASFETVICLDVLEHVPPADRVGFVAELARVAARRVLIACPSSEGAWVDDSVRMVYQTRGLPCPAWLSEHDELGLPTPAEIRQACESAPGFAARELQMTNGLLSTLAVWADEFPQTAAEAAEQYRGSRAEWLDVFTGGRFGECYRKGFAIERDVARRPRVSAADVAGSVWPAVRCPACGSASLTGRGSSAVCRTCAHFVTREDSGAFDLTAAVPDTRRVLAPVQSTRSKRLLVEPDWSDLRTWVPLLWTYVATTYPAMDCALCIDGRRERARTPHHSRAGCRCVRASSRRPSVWRRDHP